MAVANIAGPEVYDFEVETREDLQALIDEEIVRPASEYPEFEDFDDMYSFVTGTGEYGGTPSFNKDEEDLARQRLELNQMAVKCHLCMEDVAQYLSEGAMRGEVDKDPNINPQYWTDDHESYEVGVEEVVDHHLTGGCQDHQDVWFDYIETEKVD